MKFILFLRGINVGGIKVPMADLRHCLTEIGLRDVKTYLQTGNVVFNIDRSAKALKPLIEDALTKRFGYTAFVLLYPFSVLGEVIDAYPFAADESTHRYVIFCRDQGIVDELMSCSAELDETSEAIAAGACVVYWRTPKGSTTDTPFSKVLAKPKYKAVTTNRNLNTLEKMV